MEITSSNIPCQDLIPARSTLERLNLLRELIMIQPWLNEWPSRCVRRWYDCHWLWPSWPLLRVAYRRVALVNTHYSTDHSGK